MMQENKNNLSLAQFMIKKIIRLDGELPLTVACRRFVDHKVGSLLIETSDKKYACLTKSDIIKVIGRGLDPGLERTQDVASKPLIVISQDESLEDAMLLMSKKGLKRLFITDNKDEIVGVISSSDIIRIAPGLIEIAREEMLIKASEESEQNRFSGNCDDCKAYSEFLQDIGGFALCENCIKNRNEEDDDEIQSTLDDDDFAD
jgi:CBS domain-containing protein